MQNLLQKLLECVFVGASGWPHHIELQLAMPNGDDTERLVVVHVTREVHCLEGILILIERDDCNAREKANKNFLCQLHKT